MFVDDLMIMGSGDTTEWEVIKEIVQNFCQVLGLNINKEKSRLLLNEASVSHRAVMEILFQMKACHLVEGTK